MRTRTFVLSFLVHAIVLCAAMVVRLFAATELPDPPRSTSFMMAAAEVPEVQPPPAPRQQAAASAVSPSIVPIEAPTAIAPELPTDISDVVPPDRAVLIVGPGVPDGDPFGPPPPPARRVVAPPPPAQPLKVGGIVRAPQKIHHVAPTYPAIAQSARVEGMVILEALIAEDGSVREVKVLKSLPLLDASAVDAVRQWRFTPTLLNGVPVQVIMSVTVTFALH